MKGKKKKFIQATTKVLIERGYGKIKSRLASEIAYTYMKADKLEEKTIEKLNNLTEEEMIELKEKIKNGEDVTSDF